MVVDIFTHIYPGKFRDELAKCTSGPSVNKRQDTVPSITDLDARFREMDTVEGLRQVVTLPLPVLEEVVSPADASRLARIANDEMAALCAAHPDRFPAFAATVSLTDVDSAAVELERALKDLGAKGVQIYTNIVGRPIDLPEFQPIFDIMAEHDLPIWLHPARNVRQTDYAIESHSRYELWWCFGYPYETSLAMSRLVLSGLFDRHPDLKIITHHLGGMIPFFEGRIEYGMQFLGTRRGPEDFSGVLDKLKRPLIEYFHRFYGDTAMMGSSVGLLSGLKFFGPDHIVFASDAPFAPVRSAYDALAQVDLTAEERRKIEVGNAEKLLKMKLD